MTMLEEAEKSAPSSPGMCGRIQRTVVGGMERAFQRYGEFVAKWWWVVILASMLVFASLFPGSTMLEKEKNQLKLWLSADHPYRINNEWLASQKPPSKTRYNSIVVFVEDLKGDKNVLAADVIKKLYLLRKQLGEINVGVGEKANSTWEKVCSRKTVCQEGHILEIWAVNKTFNADSEAAVNGLSDQDIIDAINNPATVSGISGRPYKIEGQLGDNKKDSSGKIVSAKAMTLFFRGDSSDEGATESAREWEEEFIDVVIKWSKAEIEPMGVKALPMAARSSGDIVGEDIGSDVNLLSMGFILVLVFALVMIGRFNLVQARPFLSLLGLMCVGLGLYSSYGICGYVGLADNDLNMLLGFLLLGIGVDDMFVIVQSFDNLRGEELGSSLTERFGLTMKHAGVAILVTSVTDLLAFGIGGTTAFPMVGSFCAFAALGIFFVFFFITTFFFGWFHLDQKRMESERNFLICCYKHKEYKPNDCSQKSIQMMIFEKYAELLSLWPVKGVVILITLGALSGGIYGVTQLEANFSSDDWIKEGTYLREYVEVLKTHFTSASGASGKVYIGGNGLDFSDNMGNIKTLIQSLKNETKPEGSILDDGKLDTCFPVMFENWVTSTYQSGNPPSDQYPQKALDSTTFDTYLAEYLFSGGGMAFAGDLVFEGSNPPQPNTKPKIKLLSLPLSHKKTEKRTDMIGLMNDLGNLLDKERAKFPAGTNLFAQSDKYMEFIIMETITAEIGRNLGLALLVVFLATMFLLAHLIMSLLVAINVAITLVNVAGYIALWGLSLDTVVSIFLTIALGLAVDYSAHIAHAFMVTRGDNRNERMRRTVSEMGPAVFNGGFSTFLAFALLMMSQSYIFKSFFKIFFLVVLFGLFHGLVLLPVVLSIIGPDSSASDDDKPERKEINTVEPIEKENRPTSAWDGN